MAAFNLHILATAEKPGTDGGEMMLLPNEADSRLPIQNEAVVLAARNKK